MLADFIPKRADANPPAIALIAPRTSARGLLLGLLGDTRNAIIGNPARLMAETAREPENLIAGAQQIKKKRALHRRTRL